MNKLTIPDRRLVMTTFDSKYSEFNFDYSDEIKEFIINAMDIDKELLSELRFAWFTNYENISDNFIVGNVMGFVPTAGFRPEENLVIISVDYYNSDESLSDIIHEVGHFLSLHGYSTTIAEGCAVYYERKWYVKNNNIDRFNEKYKSNINYAGALKLIDMIKEYVFDDDQEMFENTIKRGNDDIFLEKLDIFLHNKGCKFSAKQILFLADIAHYKQDIFEMSRLFKTKPPYFYGVFDQLHSRIFPVLFSKSSNREEIDNVNRILDNYMDIVNLSLQLLDSIKDSNVNYSYFSTIYKKVLAKEIHSWDVKEYYSWNEESLSSFIRKASNKAFEKTYHIYELTYGNDKQVKRK